MTAKAKVRFHTKTAYVRLPERKRLKDFILTLFKKEQQELFSLDYIFCSDKDLLKINLEFLKHDYLTDIITFDLSESREITAEIYISIDRVKENARDLSLPFQEELHRVIFHGALHLCGYRDKSKKEQLLMRKKENRYLKDYFSHNNVPRETFLR
jgi:rRNA maturation RNase YbeY